MTEPTDDDLEALAASLGLERYLAADPESLRRACRAAAGYARRRAAKLEPADEPAHVMALVPEERA